MKKEPAPSRRPSAEPPRRSKPRRQPKPSKVATPEAMLVSSADWTLQHLPAAEAVAAPRRSVARSAEPRLPEPMTRGDFEVLDVVEATPAATRRRAQGEMPLRAVVPSDVTVLLVVRQESGAVHFRRPETVTRRTVRRGATTAVEEVEVEFLVPVLPGDPQTVRRGMLNKIGAILVKVVTKVADLIVDPLAQLVVPVLARELENRLWQKRKRGWLRVTQSALAADTLEAGLPSFPENQRGLLLIHGTFSTAHGGFRALAQDSVFAALRETYGDNIFAYNHLTFSVTPEENARELLAALPPGNFTFDVVTHSRGGLVLRTLTELGADLGSNAARLNIGRVVLVASPNAGTPLASPQHWEDKLSWFANLLELLPDHPFVTGADWLTNALIWFGNKVLGNSPGLEAMDGRGEIIAELQAAPTAPIDSDYYALVSNFEPPKRWLARLADMGVDAFLGGANDLVVPTEGGWQTDEDLTGWVPGERIGCFGPGGNITTSEPVAVHHGGFFARPEGVDFILKALRGEPLGLTAIDPGAVLHKTRRGGRRLQDPPKLESGATSRQALPASSTPEEKRQEPMSLGASGWDDEEMLLLTIIAHQRSHKRDADAPPPLLLATYSSARVAVPFYTRNQKDADISVDAEVIAQRFAGSRWKQIIDMQQFMVSYTNGGELKSLEVDLPDGTKKEFDEPDDEFLKLLGKLLFEMLFPGQVKRLYDAARFSHDKRRLHIVFSSMIPWIADLPWELAFDPGSETFLSTSDVRFTRNVLSSTPGNRIPNERSRLRILVVSAQPDGSIPLSIDEERSRIVDSFKPLTEQGLVEISVLARATPEALHGCLRERADRDEFDVVHFIGHGVFDEESGVGHVLFEDENGRERPVSAEQLLSIVRGRGVRIVFLNACETGRGASAKYNQGVAMVLARDGLPAVVANQYSVVDSAASLFSLHFYACLASGIGIADAMREARIAVSYSQTEPMDWGVPVLFARNPHAALCTRRTTLRGESLSRAAFPQLFGQRRGRRLDHPLTVAVWSMSFALTYREKLPALLERMNAAQDQFGFVLREQSIPAWLWTVESGTGYLNAAKIGSRLERKRQRFGVDYLFCVTDLKLRDEEYGNLYLWTGDPAETDGQSNLTRVGFFSLWELTPPLHGHTFATALANSIAIVLAEDLSEVVGGKDEPKHTLGYFNAEKDVAHLAGRLTITPKMRKAFKAKGKITDQQIAALETLLELFHTVPPSL